MHCEFGQESAGLGILLGNRRSWFTESVTVVSLRFTTFPFPRRDSYIKKGIHFSVLPTPVVSSLQFFGDLICNFIQMTRHVVTTIFIHLLNSRDFQTLCLAALIVDSVGYTIG